MDGENTAPAVEAPVVSDATPTDSATVETTSSDATDSSDGFLTGFTGKETEQPSTESPVEEDAGQPQESEEETPQGEQTLKPKAENRFQKLANENSVLRQQIADYDAQLQQLTGRNAQVAQEQGLLNEIDPNTGQYYTAEDAARVARYNANEQMQQQLQSQIQTLQIGRSRLALTQDAQSALDDFPMFDESKPEYNKALAQQADALLGQQLVFNDQNEVIGSRMSPYQIYQTIAEANSLGATKGEIEGQKATTQMLSRTDTVPGAAQKDNTDPFLKGFLG